MPQAIRIAEHGGPEVLKLVEIPLPTAGDGELVVEVKAAGVNPVDLKIRQGAGAYRRENFPIGIGLDAGGVVVEVGNGVTGFQVGDAVIGRRLPGAYATHIAAPADQFDPLPAGVGFEEAAAFGVPISTAYQVLKSIGLKDGETLLVHAGAGAVGQAAIQFARLWGAKVIATASPQNHERLEELGAIPVEYGDGLLERVKAVAPDGVDAALDAIGSQEALEVSLALVSDPARIGEIVVTDWAADYGVSVYSGSRPGFMPPEAAALRNEAVAYAAKLVANDEFDLEIAEVYPLSEATKAHEQVATGHVRGKIVLIP